MEEIYFFPQNIKYFSTVILSPMILITQLLRGVYNFPNSSNE